MSTINIGDISNATFKVGAVDCSIYLGDVKLYPKGFDGKYKFVLSDSTVVTADCDSTSAITSAETSAYTSTIVSAEIGDCVTKIDYNAFAFSTLSSVTIPNSVTSIGTSAFGVCSGLTSVVIPNSIKTIGQSAFIQCESLTSVIIGSDIIYIYADAFRNCTSLTSVTINADTPPRLMGAYVFFNTNNCPIYVPSESVEAYKTANYWNSYADRIQPIS